MAADLKFLFDLIPGIRFQLAQTERNFLLFLVHSEHDRFDLLTDSQNIGWPHDALRPGELRDVNQAFHAFLQFHESAIGDEVRDLAFDLLTGRKTLFNLIPRIPLRLLQAKRNTLLLLVDIEHDHFELLADFDELTWVPKASPSHVGDVEESIHAIEINECTKVGQVLYSSDDAIADFDTFEKLLPFFAPFLLDDLATAKHDIAPVIVNFDDFEIVGVPDELLEILRRNDVDL